MINMKNKFNLYIGLALLGLASSCAPSLDELEATKGTADFSKYIAVGNSLTAGYANNGLYLEGQKVAFPNLIAEKMKEVGGGAFTSPFFSADQANGSGYITFKGFTDSGSPITEPVAAQAERGKNAQGGPLYTKYLDPIQNLGVPGMRLDLGTQPGMGSEAGNPYFERLLPDATKNSTSYLQYVGSHDYTFFSFWLGNNDVLGFATNGGVESNITNKLISLETFKAAYTAFITTLTQGEKKGVVATIPDVTSVPFFNTVTTARINAAVEAETGGQAKNVYIATGNGTPRLATAKDLFILTFPTAKLGVPNALNIPYGLHPLNPIESKYVLDEGEINLVVSRISEINAFIKETAAAKKLALADVHAFLNKVKTGYIYNGVMISSAYITGNAFSLDGVHLTPMGNAIVANLFIDAINKQYGSSIGKMDISLYPGVNFPG